MCLRALRRDPRRLLRTTLDRLADPRGQLAARRDRRRGALDDDRRARSRPGPARVAGAACPAAARRPRRRSRPGRAARPSSSARRAAPRCQGRSARSEHGPCGKIATAAPCSERLRGGRRPRRRRRGPLDRDPAERVEHASDDAVRARARAWRGSAAGRSSAAPRKNGSESESWFATTITGPGGTLHPPTTSRRQTRADRGRDDGTEDAVERSRSPRTAADRPRGLLRPARVPLGRAVHGVDREERRVLAVDERRPVDEANVRVVGAGVREHAVEPGAARPVPDDRRPDEAALAARRSRRPRRRARGTPAPVPSAIVRAEADDDDRRRARHRARRSSSIPSARRAPDAVVGVDRASPGARRARYGSIPTLSESPTRVSAPTLRRAASSVVARHGEDRRRRSRRRGRGQGRVAWAGVARTGEKR